jgi:hypothetical protein
MKSKTGDLQKHQHCGKMQLQLKLEFDGIPNLLVIPGRIEPAYVHYLIDMLCPICKQPVKQSTYLNEVIRDERVKYLANLVTHYRHNHVKWDDSWRYMQKKNGSNWDYNKAKEEFNERAKRQYLRKCYPIFKALGIKADHFRQLQVQDSKTITLAHKLL